MSTKIEELSDTESDVSVQDLDYYEESPELEFQDDSKERNSTEQAKDINNRIINTIYDKIKEPILVTLISLILTHPLFIKGIFRIPYIEVMDSTISVNVMLSILAGIIFFIVREFV